MKKILAFLLISIPFIVKAQYFIGVATNTTPTYVYVGTLSQTSSNLGNFQKLKVDVFGGGWASTSLGVTTYYIGNRDGLRVHQTTVGSENEHAFTLKAYTNTSNNNIDFYLVTSYWSAYAVKSVILDGTTSVSQYIPNTVSTTVPSGTELSLSIKPVMITDDDGNIGINTASPDPAFKFSVNGEIRAKEITVETGWADYVFDKSYKLRSIDAVDAFIQKEHHLPEMPTTEDIKKNGMKVGEANTLLLKKIEELTLYLIKQNKRLAKVEKQLKAKQK